LREEFVSLTKPNPGLPNKVLHPTPPLAKNARVGAGERRNRYCCTEAVFWRCHRQFVSDALLARGYRIGHIFSATKVEEHTFTKFVKAEGTRLTYPSLL